MEAVGRTQSTYMIKEGTRARDILAVTFTNKAADELKNRLVTKLGMDAADVLHVCEVIDRVV